MSKSHTAASHPIELLRFLTCGSVDDGKSTLIGRLLYDSKQLFDDQLEALKQSEMLQDNWEASLANITDGLRSEREQGITIDVAYRYVATPKRRFIVADTPGHVQYTRNMVTGASTANLALILVDARNGVIEQTRRHSYLASLLGIPHLVLCVNKLDLMDYKEEVFLSIRKEFEEFSTRLSVKDITYVPISALQGDNVVHLSSKIPWYEGPPLLQFLETVHIANDRNFNYPRFPVQWVIRPRDDEHHDFRAYSGQVASGVFHVGDPILVLPAGKRTTIKEIHTFDHSVAIAYPPMAVSFLTEEKIDISRGDVIVHQNSIPYVSNEIEAMVCWMHEQPMLVGKKYLIKHTTQAMKGIVKELLYGVEINTLKEDYTKTHLRLNEIGRIKIKLQSSLVYDQYEKNRSMGSFIIIDETTHATVGAGMICEPSKDIPMPTYDDYMI